MGSSFGKYDVHTAILRRYNRLLEKKTGFFKGVHIGNATLAASPRSLEGLTHLARWRGATVGCEVAEAFVVGRILE